MSDERRKTATRTKISLMEGEIMLSLKKETMEAKGNHKYQITMIRTQVLLRIMRNNTCLIPHPVHYEGPTASLSHLLLERQ
jgi:hypothetical protein